MDMRVAFKPERDSEGYLIAPADWNRDLAVEFAAEEGLHLDEPAWTVIEFMRQYWLAHQVAPDVRHVVEHLVEARGLDKRAAKAHLFQLFPYGYVKQACKIAGMMRPRAWSTG